MIKAPSVQHEYSLIYSGDPALILPADPDERARVLRIAQDTGNWAPLITSDGEPPTIFKFRQLTRTHLGWLDGERQACSWLNGRALSGVETDDLAIRLALRSVENFGKYQVKFVKVNGQHLATTDIIDAIHEQAGDEGAKVLGELAAAVIEKGDADHPPFVIEGLRLLPWWQEAIKRGLTQKCETCMESVGDEQRQLLGCGFLPPPTDRLAPFVQPWQGLGYDGPKPTVCAGYSTSLPETIEIARAHYWKRDLRTFTQGERPTEALVMGVEIYEGAIGECQSWCIENRGKK